MIRTYGNIYLNGGIWCISQAEPHICIKLKAIFNKLPKGAKEFKFIDSPEVCHDLLWFMERYPLSISDSDLTKLKQQKENHVSFVNDLEKILLPEYNPTPVHLKNGYAGRDYQVKGMEVYLKTKRILISDDIGLGKQQPLYSKILTPSGWTTMGHIGKSDYVIGKNGKPTKVLEVFPQGVKEVYRVHFYDGSYTDSGPDHLWTVRHVDNRKKEIWQTLTLRDIMNGPLREESKCKNKGGYIWDIPLINPVEFNSKPLPIHPYILGFLLGNGNFCNNSVRISFPDHETFIRIQSFLPNSVELNQHDIFYYGITCKNGLRRFNSNPIMKALSDLGLRGQHTLNKFIPDLYLYSSVENRIFLLQGLMDSDGSASKERGSAQFDNGSPMLINQIIELVQTLGGIAIKSNSPDHRANLNIEKVYVSLPGKLNPFLLSRKANRYKTEVNRRRKLKRSIIDIEYIGLVECKCIKVEAEDGLYVTDHCIVTHNTMIAILSMLHTQTLPCVVIVQTHLTAQWKYEIEKFTNLKVHIIKVTKPYNLPEADVYITKYSCIGGWIDVFRKNIFKSAVFDEVQELRRWDSQKYRSAAELSKNVEYCLGLSASPVYNYGDEVFNVIDALKDNALGRMDDFLREWVHYGNRKVTDPKALGTYLRENFLMLRRTRQEVGRELPPVNKIVHTVEYDAETVKKADEIATELAIKVTSGSFIERGAAARDLDLFVRQQTGIAKARGVAEYCKILLENKEPIVLAAWHRSVYDILLEELSEFKPVMYTGSETPAQKEKAKEAFIKGETDCFIISLRSGIGLDGLQNRCNTVVIAELDWSPQVMEQLIGRVDRDGRDISQQVTAIYLVSDCGSDPLIIDMLGIKASQSHGILNPLDSEIQEQYSDETRIKLLAQKYLEKKIGNKHLQTSLF
jgi:superfamily II DNA or RNA helicase